MARSINKPPVLLPVIIPAYPLVPATKRLVRSSLELQLTKPKLDSYEPFGIDTEALAMVKQRTNGAAHKLGADKLEEIAFDPIDRLVEQLAQIDTILTRELKPMQKGKETRHTAVTNLISAKIKILETLLPYAYGKVPSTSSIEVNPDETKDPIKVVLTFEQDSDPADKGS